MRDTLRTTLIKNLDDIETFDRLFDLYFSLRPTAEKRTAKLMCTPRSRPWPAGEHGVRRGPRARRA